MTPGKFVGNRSGRNRFLRKEETEVSRKGTFELHFLKEGNQVVGRRALQGAEATWWKARVWEAWLVLWA